MIRLQHHYFAYRRLGFSRPDAFRFAWIVATAGVKPILVRVTLNRRPHAKY
jgi:hypothetical protein